MKRFIEGEDRHQVTLLPECLDDFVGEDNPVRVVDAFVEELDLEALGFEGIEPAATGRPEMSLSVLAYNMKRVMNLLGIARTVNAMRLAGA